jgi:hypothetical protein
MIEIDNIKLTSVFAASIVNFITEKHEENKKFVRGSYELMKFDHYCTNQELTKPIIDESLINTWIIENGGISLISPIYYSQYNIITSY